MNTRAPRSFGRHMAKRRSGRFIVLRDIQDHAIKGDLSLFDLGVYSVVHFQTDFSTGVWMGSAPRVHATAPKGAALRDVQRSMEHLEELHFLRSFRTHGQRGNTPYLVHKYQPLTGALRGKRLNAFASDDWRKRVYEPCALPDAVPDTLSDALPDTYSVSSTQEADSSRKKNPAAKTAPPVDPRHQPFVDFAYKTFEAKHRQRPNWNGKDFDNLKNLLRNSQTLNVQELERRWGHYLASTEPFTAKQGGSLGYFCSKFDAFISGPITEKGKLDDHGIGNRHGRASGAVAPPAGKYSNSKPTQLTN